MSRRALLAVLLAVPTLLVVPAVSAHHSTADYDLTRPAAATGIVTRFEWENPHSHIYLDSSADDGTVEHWVIEMDSPRGLERLGWSKDSLKPGDRVTCSGARAKDGSPRMRCTQVKLAGGTVLQSF
jgi:DNA/RNA endonuclease YhcR with UshA esterase domain